LCHFDAGVLTVDAEFYPLKFLSRDGSARLDMDTLTSCRASAGTNDALCMLDNRGRSVYELMKRCYVACRRSRTSDVTVLHL